MKEKKTGNWKACRFLLGNICSERLAYYGVAANLINYLQWHLNMGNVAASNAVNNWSGICYLFPLLGAFLADSYLGRYRTIASFSIVYLIGMILLTMLASIPGLKPRCDSFGCHPSRFQTSATFSALYLIALGSGAMKPCLSSFGADQFDESDEIERKRKSSFFNWFYFWANLGLLIASVVPIWIQMNVGWGWGFGVPAIAMAIATIFFFSGCTLYRLHKPTGSPLTRILQVIVASFWNVRVKVPDDESLLYETNDLKSEINGSRQLEHTEKLKFFDKSAIMGTQTDCIEGESNPWRLCTVNQVEELKCVIKLLPIWASGIIFAAVFSQINTMFILQANTMDQHIGRHFEIPTASLSFFNALGVLFWTPVYDRFIVPCARKFTGNEHGFSQLQRMGIGLVISTFSMIIAGVLEVARLDCVKKNGLYDVEKVPMSVLWQILPQFLIGSAEVFTFAGQLEFFYDQAPEGMRSMMSALSLTTFGLGNYLSTVLVTIVTRVTTRNGKLGWIPHNLNKGHLDYFFWLLAILSLLNFLMYLLLAKWYTYKKVTPNSPLLNRANYNSHSLY